MVPVSYKSELMNEAVDSVLGLSMRKTPLLVDTSVEADGKIGTSVPEEGQENATLHIYHIDLYVNQEPRPLWVSKGDDIESRARNWCLEQGTDDPQHVGYVIDIIKQTMQEQDLRRELAQYHDRLENPIQKLLHVDETALGDEEVFRFNASERYPPVSRK